MGQIVQKNLPCLSPECGSHDARQVYEDGTSFCFSCQKFFNAKQTSSMDGSVSSPSPSPSPRVSRHLPTPADVAEYGIRGFKDRGITKAVCEFFGVKVSYNDEGNIDTHYYPYKVGEDLSYKMRKLPKEFFWVGSAGSLFGIDKFTSGGKRVIITEGEIDALSVAQASMDKYEKIYPVISIPNAASTGRLLDHREWLRTFDEIVLCMDNDEPGQEAQERALKIVGIDKTKIVKMPADCKDANDVLVKYGAMKLMNLIWDAEQWSPVGIVKKEELWSRMTDYNTKTSLPYPDCMSGVNKKLKGRRQGEIALFISGTGCLGIDTPILMFDGGIKPVQDIVIGDIVMGPDNCPRNVLSLFRGQQPLYDIRLNDKTGFVCNEDHIISVVNNDNEGRWGLKQNDIVDVKLTDYFKWSDKRKWLHKAFKAGRLEFSAAEVLTMHPYALGVWLGDGYSAGSRISSNDIEIPNALLELGYDVEKQSAAFAWSFRGVQQILRDLNLIDNKHVPERYLRASINDRLQLLAGLLDTDGCYDNAKNMFEFSQKSERITDQFIRLCNSLGFQATKGKQVNNKFGNCFRVHVSGEGLEDIPTRLERKQARPRLQIKNALRSKMEIKPIGVGDFYGFEVDRDGRFVLGNYIVTHNSGKSTLMREIMLNTLETTDFKIGIISLEESPEETARKLSGMAINRNPANEEIPIEDLKPGFDKVFGDDRVIVLDHQGSIKDDSIMDQLEYMALMGCKEIYIDHITILVSEGADGLTGNEAIDKIMNGLLRLVKRHDVWVGLISHLRKAPTGGKSFESGILPGVDDIRGSGSIKQISFDILAFARDLTAEDDVERNTIKMAVLKSRYTGLTGSVPGAFYNQTTGRLAAIDKRPIEQFTVIS